MAKITEEGPRTIPFRKGLVKVLMSHATEGALPGLVGGRWFLAWDKSAKDWIVGHQGREPGGRWIEAWVNGTYRKDFSCALAIYSQCTGDYDV